MTPITGTRVDTTVDRLVFAPWIWKLTVATWANARTRFYLQIFVGLN